MSEEISNESLQKSVKTIGELYPILENQDGKILDGNHRAESNPKHHRKTIQTKSRLEEILVRLHAHHRRQVPQEETKALLIELAQELEKGGIPKENVTTELYKVVPFSEQYVRQLMPQEYKQPQKVEAGKVSALLVAQTVKTQDTALEQASLHKAAPKAFDAAEVKTCERCGVQTTEPKTWHGHTLCSNCETKADFNPEAYDWFFRYQERGRAKLIPKSQPATPSVESYRDREARMHPQKSKMEEELLLIIGNDDALRPIVTDRSYPIVSLTPDFVLTRHNLAIFVDGKQVHNHRQDRDKELRQKLSDRHGMKVLSITYDGNSDAEKQRIIAEIKGAI